MLKKEYQASALLLLWCSNKRRSPAGCTFCFVFSVNAQQGRGMEVLALRNLARTYMSMQHGGIYRCAHRIFNVCAFLLLLFLVLRSVSFAGTRVLLAVTCAVDVIFWFWSDFH